MRHFEHLPEQVQQTLFLHRPQEFSRTSTPALLAQALGATLYVPGSRADLAGVIRRRRDAGVRSMVIDLEDAVGDGELDTAITNTVSAVAELGDPGMLLFIRTRDAAQIAVVAEHLGRAISALSGFVAPKFTPRNALAYLDAVRRSRTASAEPLYVMPVLETPDLLFRESRDSTLSELRGLLGSHRELVLCLRLGATDLSGLYGIRRDRDLTIYHVQVVADLIGDIVNHLGRRDGTGFPITGPVWEYFANHERILKPRLRQSPFDLLRAGKTRDRLLKQDLDGLIREIVLDRSNGLTGKTVIHPTHVSIVHAMSCVSHEEFADAQDVLARANSEAPSGSDGGVSASGYRNKMNEARPHLRWAEQVSVRGNVFGVLNEDVSVAQVLAAVESP